MRGLAGPLSSFSKDSKVLEQKIKPGTTRRTLAYAAPHSSMLLVLLIVVVTGATIGIANPLIYREIINEGILKQNIPLIVRLALLIAGLGVLDAALGLAQTYLATRIGADVVVTLRTRLFEHIQRMPLAFFSRTQTGALVSRLMTDVTGRSTAFTDILSNVAGNSISVALIFAAMFVMSWRITLVVLVLLPLFVFPARYWGRLIQGVMRELYDIAAKMSSVMVERFNVGGALLGKLFGRPARRYPRIRGQGPAALGRRHQGGDVWTHVWNHVAVDGLVCDRARLRLGRCARRAPRPGSRHGRRPGLAVWPACTPPHAGLSNVQVTVMTALVSFERVFEVLDLAPMIQEKAGRGAHPAGAVRLVLRPCPFRYPSAAEVSLASLESIAIPISGRRARSSMTSISPPSPVNSSPSWVLRAPGRPLSRTCSAAL